VAVEAWRHMYAVSGACVCDGRLDRVGHQHRVQMVLTTTAGLVDVNKMNTAGLTALMLCCLDGRYCRY
jgi:hypothetical protein